MSHTQDMLRAAIQTASVAAMRAAKVTRPEVPAAKRPPPGRYAFVTSEPDPGDVSTCASDPSPPR